MTLVQIASAVSAVLVLGGVGWQAHDIEDRLGDTEIATSDQGKKIDVLVDYNARRATEDEYRRKLCRAGRLTGSQCWDVVPPPVSAKPPSEKDDPTPDPAHE